MKKFIIIMMLLALPSMAKADIGISQVPNFSLPSWVIGDGNISSSVDVCIYSTSGNYAITVSGANGYSLTNGPSTIPYALYWDDSGVGSLGITSGIALANNVRLSGQVNGNAKSSTCSTGMNARLTLNIAQSDMAAAISGTYTGTITLMVSPN